MKLQQVDLKVLVYYFGLSDTVPGAVEIAFYARGEETIYCIRTGDGYFSFLLALIDWVGLEYLAEKAAETEFGNLCYD